MVFSTEMMLTSKTESISTGKSDLPICPFLVEGGEFFE